MQFQQLEALLLPTQGCPPLVVPKALPSLRHLHLVVQILVQSDRTVYRHYQRALLLQRKQISIPVVLAIITAVALAVMVAAPMTKKISQAVAATGLAEVNTTRTGENCRPHHLVLPALRARTHLLHRQLPLPVMLSSRNRSRETLRLRKRINPITTIITSRLPVLMQVENIAANQGKPTIIMDMAMFMVIVTDIPVIVRAVQVVPLR